MIIDQKVSLRPVQLVIAAFFFAFISFQYSYRTAWIGLYHPAFVSFLILPLIWIFLREKYIGNSVIKEPIPRLRKINVFRYTADIICLLTVILLPEITGGVVHNFDLIKLIFPTAFFFLLLIVVYQKFAADHSKLYKLMIYFCCLPLVASYGRMANVWLDNKEPEKQKMIVWLKKNPREYIRNYEAGIPNFTSHHYRTLVALNQDLEGPKSTLNNSKAALIDTNRVEHINVYDVVEAEIMPGFFGSPWIRSIKKISDPPWMK